LLFGWPLIVNALLMFGYQQGDQVLIGTNFSVASLASYSLAVSITMVPGYMFQYVLNTIMLPLLSQVKDDELNYRRRFSMCSELSTFAGVLIACFLIICGEWIIVTVFGSKYSGSGALVAWLAVANTLRIIRSVTSIAAIARADTINNMLSNIYRTTSLALAAMAVIYDKPIVWIAACGVIGEILALGASWSRLYKKCGIPIWIGLRSTCIGAVFIIFSGLLTANIKSDHTWPLLLAATIFVCTVAFIVMWRSFDESQRYLTNLLRTVQNPNLLIRVLIRFASA
jgi:O-antigen/teichoic acid export membrane protein